MPHPVTVAGKALELLQVSALTGKEHWALRAGSWDTECTRHPERAEWRDSADLPLPHKLVPLLEAGRRRFLFHPRNRRPSGGVSSLEEPFAGKAFPKNRRY